MSSIHLLFTFFRELNVFSLVDKIYWAQYNFWMNLYFIEWTNLSYIYIDTWSEFFLDYNDDGISI